MTRHCLGFTSFVTKGTLCQTQGLFPMGLEDLEVTEVDMAIKEEEDETGDSQIQINLDHQKQEILGQLAEDLDQLMVENPLVEGWHTGGRLKTSQSGGDRMGS